MAFKFSTGLKNALLDTGSLKASLDGGVLVLFSGTVPSSPDDALPGDAVMLNVYTDDDQGPLFGLDFAASASAGTLSKAPAQPWKGTSVAAGNASFFVFAANPLDAMGASTTEKRVLGTVGGPGADMFVQSVAIADATEYTIDYFSVTIPDL